MEEKLLICSTRDVITSFIWRESENEQRGCLDICIATSSDLGYLILIFVCKQIDCGSVIPVVGLMSEI